MKDCNKNQHCSELWSIGSSREPWSPLIDTVHERRGRWVNLFPLISEFLSGYQKHSYQHIFSLEMKICYKLYYYLVINIFLKQLNFKLQIHIIEHQTIHPFLFFLKIYLARAVHKYFILITRRDCFSASPKVKGGSSRRDVIKK